MRRRRYDLAAVIHDFVVVLGQGRTVFGDLGRQLGSLDAAVRIPIRAKNHVRRVVGENGSLVALGSADHNLHFQLCLAAIVESTKPKLGDVDYDRRALESVWNPTPAFQGKLQLADALAERSVQLLERGLGDAPVRIEAVARLEMLHRFD